MGWLLLLVCVGFALACVDAPRTMNDADDADDADGADGADGADDADDERDAGVKQPGADEPDARPWSRATWYEEDYDERARQVTDLLDAVEVDERRRAVAAIAPHAQLSASGPFAAEVYARMEAPSVVIMLAPDHSEEGAPTAIWQKGPWLLPGSAFQLHEAGVRRIMQLLPDLEVSPEAFDDHEVELHLPFFEQLSPELRLVVLGFHDNSRSHFENFTPERIDEFGAGVAALYRELTDSGERVSIVASVDMTHHEPLVDVEAKDAILSGYITSLDVAGLYDYVTEDEITICAEVPAAILMAALVHLGHESMDEIARATSFHSSMDDQDVVGYLAAAAWE